MGERDEKWAIERALAFLERAQDTSADRSQASRVSKRLLSYLVDFQRKKENGVLVIPAHVIVVVSRVTGRCRYEPIR